MSHQSQVPKTKVRSLLHTKGDKFWLLVNNIILYLQFCTLGRNKLAAERRLEPKTDFRLSTERNLCLNILLNAAGLSRSIIMTACHQLVYDETGKVRTEFEEELKSFCDTIAPRGSIIISDSGALALEMQRLMKKRVPGVLVEKK